MTKTLWVLPIAVGMALSGCGKKSEERAASRGQEKAIEIATGGKVKMDSAQGKMTVTGNKGEKIEIATNDGKGVKVPGDFPKDVPVYKGAKVESSVKTGDTAQLVLTTPDAADKVAETYKTEMKKSGWAEKTVMTMSEMTMLQYTKDKQSATVQVMKEEGKGSRVMLTVSKEPEK